MAVQQQMQQQKQRADSIAADAVDAFRSSLHGPVLRLGDPGSAASPVGLL